MEWANIINNIFYLDSGHHDVTMLLLTRRRNAKTLLVAAGAVVSLFIVYHLSRNQRPEVPLEKVYPDIRFAGTGRQRSPSGIPRIIHQTWKSGKLGADAETFKRDCGAVI